MGLVQAAMRFALGGAALWFLVLVLFSVNARINAAPRPMGSAPTPAAEHARHAP